MTATVKSRTARPQTRRRFDDDEYGKLLAQTVPAVIRNEAECRRVEAEIAKLLRKGESLTPEEERLLDLLSALVERYEDETEDFPASPPHRVLQFLMEQNDLKQTDLVQIFGSSGRVSEVVNGKRGISKTHAARLARRFGVPVGLFVADE